MELTWPEHRAAQILKKIRRLEEKTEIRYTFQHSSETDFIDYFAKGLAGELEAKRHLQFRYDCNAPDVILLTAHGRDLSEHIWSLRAQIGEEVLIAVWLWDNHLGHVSNLKTSL